MTSPSQHIIFLLNPYYQEDPIGEHLTVLQDTWLARDEEGAPKPHVWFGKVRSRQRTDLGHPHLEEFLKLEQQIKRGLETHLYLTDLDSLWVGHLMRATKEDPRQHERQAQIPPYYSQKHFEMDLWFKIRDLRLLIQGGGSNLHRELRELEDVHYGKRTVSLFGGIYQWPISVTEKEPQTYFDPLAFRDDPETASGQLPPCWALRQEICGHELSRTALVLRDHLIGHKTWRRLCPDTRYFLAAAERSYRENQASPGFDFSSVVVQYSKALESDFRQRLAPTIRAEQEKNGIQLSLPRVLENLTIGEIQYALAREKPIYSLFKNLFSPSYGSWLHGPYARFLHRFTTLRNAAAHRQKTARTTLDPLREELLGIGCEGIINRLLP